MQLQQEAIQILNAFNLFTGVFNEPTLDLVKVLGKLQDENNRIQISGWYDTVRHNTLEAALERLDALNPPEFTLQEYKETLGIPELNDKVVDFFELSTT